MLHDSNKTLYVSKNTDADLPIGSLSLTSGRRPGGTLPRKSGNLYETES